MNIFLISGNVVASLQNTSNTTFNVGDQVQVNLSVNNVTNLSGIQVNVSYDPSVLSYNTTQEGTFLNENGTIATYFNSSQIVNTSGHINYLIIFREGENYGVTGNGTLAYLYFNATSPGTSYVNITDALFSDNNGNQISSSIQNTTITVNGTIKDKTPPAVILNSPTDNYSTTNQTIAFNATGSDNINLTNMTLYGNWTGSWTQNITNLSPLNNTITTFLVNNIPEGKYIWNVYACDNSNNCAFSGSTKTVTVDKTPPTITIISPASGSTLSSSNVTIDISFSDNTNLNYCSYNITTSTGQIAIPGKQITCKLGSIDYESISDGSNYVISAFANDTSGNEKVLNKTFSINTSTSSTTTQTGGGGGGSNVQETNTTNQTIPSEIETLNITPESPGVFRQFSSDTGISQIYLYVNNGVQNVTINVSRYNSKPNNVSVSMPGKVYEYLHITPENLGNSLENATIYFNVNQSWSENESVAKENISLFKYYPNQSSWKDLNAMYIGPYNSYYSYEAELNNFSYFAIAEKIPVTVSIGIQTTWTSLKEFISQNTRVFIVIWISAIILIILAILIVLVLRYVSQFHLENINDQTS